MIEFALQRAVERGWIKEWSHADGGKWWVTIPSELPDSSSVYAFSYSDAEVVAFCHGLLAASEPERVS